ncbi:TPA: DUF7706 family protein [Salmonella enterica]|uniref:Uncharacterized protein n=2 Tax=Salmonella enterica TaxID=28901 RepID=A0A3V8I3D5_SALER|nr:hypothetical protein [Salmonella enterica]ECC9155776.1 hypothetical protein [Salmonella enterica subsp. salamae]AZT26284.1 hypothetical protein ELZ76_21295 [Salmonella enterica subsp. salamae serovar 42:r:-]AZT52428.1 hypothetical protein EL003_21225 [Salmonella enterica subsp. salamae serovar 42:r:-]AZT56942.1 hypothetical protein EL009_21305 [Salmonella enterica subsp. salamae serovar 42:r:-]EAA9058248.1 hypothetical protein [Salmonella enterica]
MKLQLELTDDEALALSHLAQSLTWNTMRDFVMTNRECDEMLDAVRKLEKTLTEHGYRHQYGCLA